MSLIRWRKEIRRLGFEIPGIFWWSGIQFRQSELISQERQNGTGSHQICGYGTQMCWCETMPLVFSMACSEQWSLTSLMRRRLILILSLCSFVTLQLHINICKDTQQCWMLRHTIIFFCLYGTLIYPIGARVSMRRWLHESSEMRSVIYRTGVALTSCRLGHKHICSSYITL